MPSACRSNIKDERENSPDLITVRKEQLKFMTMAICSICGMEKFGAWTRCVQCGHNPKTPKDRAESMFLTDFYIPPAELRKIAIAIRQGTKIHYDPAAIEELKADISELTDPPSS